MPVIYCTFSAMHQTDHSTCVNRFTRNFIREHTRLLAYWCSRLKALAVNGAGHLTDLGRIAYLVNSLWLKSAAKRMSSIATDLAVYAKCSSSSTPLTSL